MWNPIQTSLESSPRIDLAFVKPSVSMGRDARASLRIRKWKSGCWVRLNTGTPLTSPQLTLNRRGVELLRITSDACNLTFSDPSLQLRIEIGEGYRHGLPVICLHLARYVYIRMKDIVAMDEFRLILDTIFGFQFLGSTLDVISAQKRKSAATVFRENRPGRGVFSFSGSNSPGILGDFAAPGHCANRDLRQWSNAAVLHWVKSQLSGIRLGEDEVDSPENPFISFVEVDSGLVRQVVGPFRRASVTGQVLSRLEREEGDSELSRFLAEVLAIRNELVVDVLGAGIRRLWRERCYTPEFGIVRSKLWNVVVFDLKKIADWETFDHLTRDLSDAAFVVQRFFSTARVFTNFEDDYNVLTTPRASELLLQTSSEMNSSHMFRLAVQPFNRSLLNRWFPIYLVFRIRRDATNSQKLDLSKVDDLLGNRFLDVKGDEARRLVVGMIVGCWYLELDPDGNGLVIPKRFSPSSFFFPMFARVHRPSVIAELPRRLAEVVVRYNTMPRSEVRNRCCVDFVNDVLLSLELPRVFDPKKESMFGFVARSCRAEGHFPPKFLLKQHFLDALETCTLQMDFTKLASLVGREFDFSTHASLDEFVKLGIRAAETHYAQELAPAFLEDYDYLYILDRLYFYLHMVSPEEDAMKPYPPERSFKIFATGCPWKDPREPHAYVDRDTNGLESSCCTVMGCLSGHPRLD